MLSCYEAGREAFWVHRALTSTGLVNLVVDSASIEVNRRRRRAKTDRLDATALVDLLVRHDLGGRRVLAAVRVPTPEQEDARQLHRELCTAKVAPDADWLEIGCGTGALTSAILERARPRSVTACDTAEDFVAYCSSTLRHAHFTVVTATTDTLPRRAGGYDVVVSSLVLNFLPDPIPGLASMRDVCAPRGCVAACVWDYSEGMEFLRLFWDAAASLDPKAIDLHEGARFPLCQAAALRSAFLRAGLEGVEVEALTIPTKFADFDDYWLPFINGPGPAPTYVASLSESHRQDLAALLRERLRQAHGGALDLTARAWAAKGVRGVP